MGEKEEKMYLCIDLKSFYASAECVERGLDPMKTNLVVADPSRGRGAICLAITPPMKELGIKNRCRIFEIPKGVKFITALPRMKHYMELSAQIYSIYLKYIAPEDIHIYSIDECFIDISSYRIAYDKTPWEMAVMLMDAVLNQTGIRATAGIGTNLFLAKVALDISAKHSPDHIGYLDEEEFKKTIWHHRPITDIWNIGRGIAKRLERYCVFDLYGVAHMSEKQLYSEFGVNAEYLIDHSHGYEPCTIREIQAYKPKSNSLSIGQILFENYPYEDALLVLREMVDTLALELVEKNLVTGSLSLYVGYENENEKPSSVTRRIGEYTNSAKKLTAYFEELFWESVKKECLVRRMNIGFNNVIEEIYAGVDFFSDIPMEQKERRVQNTVISIKNKYGKNAVLKGISLNEKATAQKRNKLIGGHNGE